VDFLMSHRNSMTKIRPAVKKATEVPLNKRNDFTLDE